MTQETQATKINAGKEVGDLVKFTDKYHTWYGIIYEYNGGKDIRVETIYGKVKGLSTVNDVQLVSAEEFKAGLQQNLDYIAARAVNLTPVKIIQRENAEWAQKKAEWEALQKQLAEEDAKASEEDDEQAEED